MTASGTRLVTTSRSYRRARAVVSAWVSWYTSGLEPALARDRRDEVASDLWEQGAEGDRRSSAPVTVAASILWRAARGIPNDLLWRDAARGQVRHADTRDRFDRLTASTALTIGLLVLCFGAFADGRLLLGLIQHSHLPSVLTAAGTVVGSMASVGGLLLERRGRRVRAGILFALGTATSLPFGMLAITTLSSTAQYLESSAVGTGPIDPTALWTTVWAAVTTCQIALLCAAFSSRRSNDERNAS